MDTFKVYYEANILYYEANIANIDNLKGEIVDLLRYEGRTKPNLEPGGPIHKWFMNSFMKWATQPSKNYELEDMLGLEPHEYKEGEPEWMKKPDVMDFQGHGLVQLHSHWPKFQHMIDYFNSLSDREREKIVKKPYDQVEDEVAAWDVKLSKAKISDASLKEGTDYDVLYKDGDYTWVKLATKAAYKCEGEAMGHCVGGYDPDSPDNTIISLWDKKGEPHVTIEMQQYGGEPGQPEGDFEEIIQIKGKANRPPADKYKDITARFVKKWLDKGTFNEQAKNISELEPSHIVRSDGEGIGMFRHEGHDGAWHWYFEDSEIWDKIYKMDILPMQQARIQDVKKRMFEDPSVDGLIIDGDANLSYSFFKEIPKELANVSGVMDGNFNVQNNLLTSLKNSPLDIEGNFYAAHNELETLEGGPLRVDKSFYVDNNNLKNLKGLPEHISGDLHINANPLESLEGAENTYVGGTVFVGGWPISEEPADIVDFSIDERAQTAAPDFLKPDKVIAAFKHIGEGKPKGKMNTDDRQETEGEVQYIAPGVRVYPLPHKY